MNGIGIGFVVRNLSRLNTNKGYLFREYRLIVENRYINNKNSLQLAINYLRNKFSDIELHKRFHIGSEYGYVQITTKMIITWISTISQFPLNCNRENRFIPFNTFFNV